MPLIRGEATVPPLSEKRRGTLLKLLKDELDGNTSPDGPAIFEMPLESTDMVDVIVVWDEFGTVSSTHRAALILKAYKDTRSQSSSKKYPRISVAMGVTYQEANEQGLLPYAILPSARNHEANPAELRKAMIEEGGMLRPGDKIDLRFPMMSMAKAALNRLCKRFPQGNWLIKQYQNIGD